MMIIIVIIILKKQKGAKKLREEVRYRDAVHIKIASYYLEEPQKASLVVTGSVSRKSGEYKWDSFVDPYLAIIRNNQRFGS